MKTNWKITQPCSKKWDELMPAENGRYCSSCNKVVADLGKIKPGDPSFSGCGMLKESKTDVSVSKLNFFQSKLIRWFGVAGLFFIPSKKIKAQQYDSNAWNEIDTVNKRFYNPKRVVGTLRDVDRTQPRSKRIQLHDSTGIIADSLVTANGKFIFDIDTAKIKGDSLVIIWDSLKTSIPIEYIWSFTDTFHVGVYTEYATLGWCVEVVDVNVSTTVIEVNETPEPFPIDSSAEKESTGNETGSPLFRTQGENNSHEKAPGGNERDEKANRDAVLNSNNRKNKSKNTE